MNRSTRNRLILLLAGAGALCFLPVATARSAAPEQSATVATAVQKPATGSAGAAGSAEPVRSGCSGDSESPDNSDSLRQTAYKAGYKAGYEVGYRDGIKNRKEERTCRRPVPQPVPTSDTPARRFLHSLSAEFRPEYIFPTNSFLKTANRTGKPIDLSLSGHFRYAFQFRPGSVPDRIYGGAYQGLGIACYDFQRPGEIGNPVAFYLFQGARIARLAPRISFDYEWNFGLSFGWKPYDRETNPLNMMMGSKINAYLNVDFLFRWQIMREVDLTAGLVLTHFSNGNTKFPNAGLNSLGARAGLTCHFGRTAPEIAPRNSSSAFPRHMSYDLVLFGSWRRRGIEVGDKQYAAPDAYTVVGFNFAPMYNFGYKFRAGVALDGVYDGSANVIPANTPVEIGSTPEIETVDPGFDRQIALGVSARAEFVMPYFQIGIGLGANVLHKGGDLNAFYQMLTLKVAVTRSSFIHIGYSLRDFHLPNFLMLGAGYRFNNKYPRHR